jgi:hypothetical protein
MMRHKRTAIALAALVAAVVSCAHAGAGQKGGRRGGDDLPERDELRRTYQLAAGARVELLDLSGAVEVETVEGDEAEVRVVRTARTRAELAYRNVVVEGGASGLRVRGEREREGAVPRGVEVRTRVLLRIPRRVELAVKGVSGAATIGDVDGPVTIQNVSGAVRVGDVRGPLSATGVSGPLAVGRVGDRVQLRSVSGNVTLGQAVGHLELREVSGDVTVAVARLDRRGVVISNVSGAVELRFAGAPDADVEARRVDGRLRIDLPGVTWQSTPERTLVRARVGAGGAPISIAEVSGSVRLTRLP